jgi:hypothetical protein
LREFVTSRNTINKSLGNLRREAEANLVKLRIIAKKSRGVGLSPIETEYLKVWTDKLTQGDLHPLIPDTETQLSCDVMIHKDKEHLETLTLLGASKALRSVSLSDFLLELSLIYSETVVDKAEYKVYARGISSRWGLPEAPDEMSLSNQVRLYADKCDQNAFQESFYLDDQDKKNIKDLYNVARLKGDLDRLWKEADNESLDAFMECASTKPQVLGNILNCNQFVLFT